jgi:hypothetical protein
MLKPSRAARLGVLERTQDSRDPSVSSGSRRSSAGGGKPDCDAARGERHEHGSDAEPRSQTSATPRRLGSLEGCRREWDS